MNRRSLLQALALTPLAALFPFLRTAEARPEDYWLEGVVRYFPEGLHIWVSEGEDIVIARDQRDAVKVFMEMTGPWKGNLPSSDDMPSLFPECWEQWPDSKPFDLCVEEGEDQKLLPKFEEIGTHTGVFCHGANGVWTVSAKPVWWATRNGRGYLGSRA
jgi:hypothetical protein